MKIPTEESSNVYESSSEFSPDNSEGGNQEGNNSPSADGDFSEYLWMENEEEFDKQVGGQFVSLELYPQNLISY